MFRAPRRSRDSLPSMASFPPETGTVCLQPRTRASDQFVTLLKGRAGSARLAPRIREPKGTLNSGRCRIRSINHDCNWRTTADRRQPERPFSVGPGQPPSLAFYVNGRHAPSRRRRPMALTTSGLVGGAKQLWRGRRNDYRRARRAAPVDRAATPYPPHGHHDRPDQHEGADNAPGCREPAQPRPTLSQSSTGARHRALRRRPIIASAWVPSSTWKRGLDHDVPSSGSASKRAPLASTPHASTWSTTTRPLNAPPSTAARHTCPVDSPAGSSWAGAMAAGRGRTRPAGGSSGRTHIVPTAQPPACPAATMSQVSPRSSGDRASVS